MLAYFANAALYNLLVQVNKEIYPINLRLSKARV